MLESTYQNRIIKRLKKEFPDCIVIKNPSDYIQGIPDLLILFEDRWAALEVKISEFASDQPNQRYYVDLLNYMSFAAFVYPKNEEQVFNDLQNTFRY